MSKFNFALLASATAISSSAYAADLPSRKGPPVMPVLEAPFSWTGFYIGAQAGYGWGSEHDNLSRITGLDPATQLFFDTFHTSGALGGVHLGYNYQFGMWVLGAEGEFDVSSMRGRTSGSNSQFEGINVTTLSLSSRVQGSIRGRVGLAFDRFLVYGTGGLALANVTETASYNTYFNQFSGFINQVAYGSHSQTLIGWTAGGGVAYAIDNHWIINVEARYTDFGAASYPLVFNSPPANLTYSARFTETTVTGGISYKF